jgi:hypothetical protein
MGIVAVPLTFHEVAVMSAVPGEMPATSPVPLTDAIAVSAFDQVTGRPVRTRFASSRGVVAVSRSRMVMIAA